MLICPSKKNSTMWLTLIFGHTMRTGIMKPHSKEIPKITCDCCDNHCFCLFVCFVDKTRTVKPLGCFHSRILSFTQDDPAFSTKTAQRALQVAKVCNLQFDELARLIIWCNFTGKLDKLGCLYAGDSNRFLIDPHEILWSTWNEVQMKDLQKLR